MKTPVDTWLLPDGIALTPIKGRGHYPDSFVGRYSVKDCQCELSIGEFSASFTISPFKSEQSSSNINPEGIYREWSQKLFHWEVGVKDLEVTSMDGFFIIAQVQRVGDDENGRRRDPRSRFESLRMAIPKNLEWLSISFQWLPEHAGVEPKGGAGRIGPGWFDDYLRRSKGMKSDRN